MQQNTMPRVRALAPAAKTPEQEKASARRVVWGSAMPTLRTVGASLCSRSSSRTFASMIATTALIDVLAMSNEPALALKKWCSSLSTSTNAITLKVSF